MVYPSESWLVIGGRASHVVYPGLAVSPGFGHSIHPGLLSATYSTFLRYSPYSSTHSTNHSPPRLARDFSRPIKSLFVFHVTPASQLEYYLETELLRELFLRSSCLITVVYARKYECRQSNRFSIRYLRSF